MIDVAFQNLEVEHVETVMMSLQEMEAEACSEGRFLPLTKAPLPVQRKATFCVDFSGGFVTLNQKKQGECGESEPNDDVFFQILYEQIACLKAFLGLLDLTCFLSLPMDPRSVFLTSQARVGPPTVKLRWSEA